MVQNMKPPAMAHGFLEQCGWQDAEIIPVAGDASFRRYFRVVQETRQAILMDAPPPEEDPRPFIAIARHLREQQFLAPEILASDLDHGLVLIEDFGDRRMREYVDAHPDREIVIYEQAINLLKSLHKKPSAKLPPYDQKEYMREVNLVTQWYCPAQKLVVDTGAFEAAWREVLEPVLAYAGAPVTVLRDYHAENIMLLSDNRLGLLDFQDALSGHRAYDLVSLLQDARRDVSDAIEQTMLDLYLDGMSGADRDIFLRDYAIIGAQRNAKIIGIFTRLWKRDGKERYLDFLPRMWRMLEKDLTHPALKPVKNWFDLSIPSDIRSRNLMEG